MRHIIIRNLGPLVEADVTLNKINIIVGPQSAGKSCLLKTTCFCEWVEKRIQLSQEPDKFKEDGFFEKKFIEFHKLDGYTSEDTYIEYENDSIHFSYSWKDKVFDFHWIENGRWNYVCPKISYIPAERNLVAAIPNWFEVRMNNDNIRNFMKDWQDARSVVTGGLPILNLGVTYSYDKKNNMDKVDVGNGTVLDFTNTSSGLQSLIPLMVHLNYLYDMRFKTEQPKNIFRIQEEKILRGTIFENMSKIALETNNDNLFHLHDNDEKARKVFDNFTSMRNTEVFLEEPEQNLFPPTQGVLAYQLMEWARGEHGGLLFVATHSPYMVTSFIERENSDIALFFNKEDEKGKYKVFTASEKDLQDIYDYGIDVFHNLNSIG